MTPAEVTRIVRTLARAVRDRRDAKLHGATFGRALAVELRADEFPNTPPNSALFRELEITLARLALSSEGRVAEVADAALHSLREDRYAGRPAQR